jgi:hypothetical protein
MLACLLVLGATARAQSAPGVSAQETYEARKKSVPLAITLEALSPIGGAGVFYAHDPTRGATIMVLSTLTAAAGVGAALWIGHLSGQQESGVNRVVQDVEEGTAISVLLTAAIFYVGFRAAGVAQAIESTNRYNDEVRQDLGLPPPEPVIPTHALAPGLMLPFRF